MFNDVSVLSSYPVPMFSFIHTVSFFIQQSAPVPPLVIRHSPRVTPTKSKPNPGNDTEKSMPALKHPQPRALKHFSQRPKEGSLAQVCIRDNVLIEVKEKYAVRLITKSCIELTIFYSFQD